MRTQAAALQAQKASQQESAPRVQVRYDTQGAFEKHSGVYDCLAAGEAPTLQAAAH